MDKSVLDNVKDSITNVFGEIVKQLKKYKKYIFLIVVILLAAFGLIKLIEHLQVEKDKVYLADKIKKELNCKGESCIYTMNTSAQNYVWYSGYLWRIIRINSDGSIKLILSDSVGLISYFNGSNNNYVDSFIRLWLNEGVFIKGLNNPDYYISDYNFCYGNEVIECNNTIRDKVGLLTYKEYMIAGGKDSYINTGLPFWLITSKKDNDEEVYIVDSTGELVTASTAKLYQIRPVINLKANTMIVTTTRGTMDNPYVLKGDEAPKGNTYLNQRYNGEYVKFAGKIWRIAETTDKYTKLILNGKDSKMQFGPTNAYIDPKNTIKSYLENVYYNILKGAVSDLDDYLENTTLYAGEIEEGDAYTNSKINNADFRNVTSRLGISVVGDLFSGNDMIYSDKDMTWTLSPASSKEDGQLWLSNGEKAKNDQEYFVRPVIYLKNRVYVIGSSGTGRTRESAFEIAAGK